MLYLLVSLFWQPSIVANFSHIIKSRTGGPFIAKSSFGVPIGTRCKELKVYDANALSVHLYHLTFAHILSNFMEA